MQTILRESERLAGENIRAILATVIDVQGSGYRLPGARMLIGETGETFGTVSGGCLESDVLERARRVLQNNEPAVLTYDTTGKTDSVFFLNMGCNGIVRILLEPVNSKSVLFKAWEIALQDRERQTVATIISSENRSSLPAAAAAVGARIIYSETERFEFENVPGFLESSGEVLDICAGFFESDGVSQIKKVHSEGGEFEFFFENIRPPLNLIIFGAGYDAIPVAKFAKDLGWRVGVVDHRPGFVSRERFPAADELLVVRPENLLPGKLTIDKNSVAVIMTHNYAHDREILKFLLSQPPLAYIGCLGPKRRTENLLRELGEENAGFSPPPPPPPQLSRLYAPVGLDIGAASPETIALSIVAEIQSVSAGRGGGFLRERQGSIYDRRPPG